jgi:hypothetical protein
MHPALLTSAEPLRLECCQLVDVYGVSAAHRSWSGIVSVRPNHAPSSPPRAILLRVECFRQLRTGPISVVQPLVTGSVAGGRDLRCARHLSAATSSAITFAPASSGVGRGQRTSTRPRGTTALYQLGEYIFQECSLSRRCRHDRDITSWRFTDFAASVSVVHGVNSPTS